MDSIKDWTTWRETLHEGIQAARKLGVSEDTIQNLATKKEVLLKELWDDGTPDERKVLATLIFKMAK
jgi:hypothetical protein